MPDPSHATGFTLNTLDRKSAQREDPAFIAALLAAPSSRSLVLSADIPALKRAGDIHDAIFTLDEARAFGDPAETVFLGCHGERALFATRIEGAAHEAAPERDDLAFVDLRTIAAQGLVDPEMIGALSQAKSLLHWHQHNRFCANCAKPSKAAAGGSRRECEHCGRHHFPRVEPVAIMLVTDGEHCLLGRQAGFPPGMYSCLAGFAEVGETLEDTVRREIMEEAGVKIGHVDYFASQPWPFPASLMIGCTARALSSEITIDTREIEDARWFSREETRLMLAREHPAGLICPPKLAIANLLISAWATEKG
ncbi:MAG: NAD(+) diphosphatase [Beijerinckiaceae bacterium]|nr:NAD(+) diphosphatase [Beijerinckiaceae bacterium]